MSFLEIHQGDSPVVLGLPHTGTEVPDECMARLNETGRAIADTDWHIHDLYAGLLNRATTVRTTVHRYVVDVNRDPDGQSLYPGQNTTGLCPLTDFDGNAIYREEHEPDAAEIAARRASYHIPYHAALRAELDRVRAVHGFVVLYDCHSIRSRIPYLFDGTLPDFNIGTNSGASCDPGIAQAVANICGSAIGYTSIMNGRFKGGWTTRHYGRPSDGTHAIQMELTQSAYMQECPPWAYSVEKADRLRPHLKTILETLSNWRPS
jgi:N-formylglutamate deformylase